MVRELTPIRVAYLALGSNLGERANHLQAAIQHLDALEGIEVTARAAQHETKPMYVEEQPDFLNTCVRIETTLDPHEILRACLDIEERLGRVRSVDKGPRTIDIDVIMYADLIIDDELLTVPHPGMLERDFVLIPLAEIAGDVVHPVTGRTISEERDRRDQKHPG